MTSEAPERGYVVVWKCETCNRVEGASVWPETIHALRHGCPAKPLRYEAVFAQSVLTRFREALLGVRADSRQETAMEDPWGSQGPPILVSANAYFAVVDALDRISQDEARAALDRLAAPQPPDEMDLAAREGRIIT